MSAGSIPRRVFSPLALILCFTLVALSPWLSAQASPAERTFPQSRSEVERALKALQSSSSGELPVLEGFAAAGDRPLDRFQRGYYQCTTQLSPAASGGIQVRVSAKITAWYADPVASKSGYQVLPSNGRLEADFLDRLQQALAAQPSTKASDKPAVAAASKSASAIPPAASISAPTPRDTVPIIERKDDKDKTSSSPFQLGSAENTEALATRKAVTDKHVEDLKRQAQNLEEILRNQSHPTNLVAVKNPGTPVLSSANEGAKVLFEASAEDEFEILDSNANWVHVRISGLSRGWIRRSSVEMPDSIAPETAPTPAVKKASDDTPPFQVENEQITSFPGDWEPLRGKTVKIISVQKAGVMPGTTGSAAKLQFTKSILNREIVELTKSSSTTAGLVVIFDTEDGGMVAATLPVLQAWKAGQLSEEAMWRRCYFDPPETFNAAKSVP